MLNSNSTVFLLSTVVLASTIALPAFGEEKHYQHLTTTSRQQIPFKKYNHSKISFVYPTSWQKKKTDDKNMLVKLGGDIANGASGEMSITLHEGEDMTVEDLKLLIDRFYLKKIPNMKVLQEKNIKFGSRRHLQGMLEDISFEMNGMPIFQRHIFFSGGKNKAYSIAFLSTKPQIKKITPVFNKILLSFSLEGTRQSLNSVARRTTTQSLSSKYVPLNLTYPNGWNVKQETGDNPVTITGKNKAGKDATIAIYKGQMHPWWTIEQVANALEAEHMKPRNHYRQLNRTNKTFGSGSSINGIVQENNFTEDGVKYKQMVAYFHDKNNAYVVSMASTGWKLSEMRQAFHKLLASLRVRNSIK